MADAFRGLTIRLGADARPLNTAINSVISHTRKAQTQLNALKKALQINPGNIRAAGMSMDLMGDKALLAARSVRDISTAMSQVSDKTKTVANANKNIYAAAHKVKNEYEHVDAELQRIYDSVVRVRAAELRNKDATLDIAKSTELARSEVEKLRSGYGKAADKTKELNRLLTVANKKDLGRMFDTKGEPEKLIGIVKKLRAEHSALAGESSQLKAAEGYKAMQYQLESWKAKLAEACQEAARFRSEIYSLNAGPGVAALTEKIKRIDPALEEATASARKLDAAFKQAPKDIALATSKLRAEAAIEESLRDKLKTQQAILNSIDAEVVKQANSVKNVYKWVAQVEHQWSEASAKVAVAESKVEAFNQELKEARNTQLIGPSRSIEKIQADLKKAEAEFDKARAKADRLDNELKTANAARRYRQTAEDVQILESQLAQATVKASALHKALDLSKTFRTMGYGLYSTITPAIMIAGRYAIQSARDIDAAWRDMRKTVNGGEEDFQHLLDAAMEFSTTHFTSAEQILEIEAMGGQLGIAVEDLEEFATVISNLDVATNIDADTAAEQLGKMATVLGISVEDYDKFGDALVRLGNNMPVMESDVLTLTTRFMGMGKVVGMQPDQMLAWAAAASATGQKAEAAGSAMQRFIAKMETAVTSGGESLQQWADVAGMSAEDFKAAFEEDASGAMYKFIEGLARIQQEGGSVNQVLQDLKINNVRDKQLLEGLAVQMLNTADGANVLSDALKMSNDAYNGRATVINGKIEEAGDAAREAAKKAEGFSGQIEMMIHDAQLLAQELAKGALPYVKALAEGFKGLTEAFKAMPDETKAIIVGLVGMVAAIGPLAVAFGALGSAVLTFMELYSKAVGARTLATASKAFTGILGPLAKLGETFPSVANGILNVATAAETVAPAVLQMVPAIAVAAATLGYLVKSISESAAKHQQHIDVVNDLNSVLYTTNPTAQLAAAGIEKLGVEAQKTAYAFDDVVEANSKMVDSLKERNQKAAAEIGTLSAAKRAIDLYANAGKNLTAEQQGELRAAIDIVNEKCGTQYQILDALTGKIGDASGAYVDSIDAIDKYIDKQEKLIQVQTLEADLAELQARRRETYVAMVSTNDDAERVKLYKEYEAINSQIEGTKKLLGETAAASEGVKMSLGQLISQSDNYLMAFEGSFNNLGQNTSWMSYQEAILAFGEALDKTGLKFEDFEKLNQEDIQKMANVWMESGGDINAVLDVMGAKAVSLQDQYNKAFSEIDSNFNSVVEQLGSSADGLTTALDNAGISVADFAHLSAGDVQSAIESCDGTVEGFASRLREISEQKMKVEVESEGVEETTESVENLEEEIESLPEGEAELDYSDYEEADDAANELSDDIEDLPSDKTVTVNVNGNARDTLSDIYWYLSNLHDKTVTVTTEKVEHAAGGFVAMHAAGAFITNGPTYLGRDANGVRHIAGEAGREWVMRHADGTTSIVPIQNRRYLKPYANTIASMIGTTTNNSPTYNITVNASGDGDDIARQVTRAIRAQELMRGRR